MISKIAEYYPLDLNTFVGNKHAIDYFRSYLGSGNVKNFSVYGLPGVGKTTFSKFLAQEISETNYSIDLSKNYLSGDYSDLVEILNSPGKKAVVIENFKFLPDDYFDLFKSYFESDNDLFVIAVFNKFSEIPEGFLNLSIHTELTKVDNSDIYTYLDFINSSEGWTFSDEVIEDIVYRSDGYMSKLFKIYQDIVVLDLFDPAKYFSHFKKRFDQYFEELIYYIRDRNRVSKILEYLLTRLTSQDIYKYFSEYCLFYFEKEDSRLYKKLGNRLLVYSKEMERLSRLSKTTVELYCDIYLLEVFVAENPDYKSIVDMSVVLPETERERRQAQMIKLSSSKPDVPISSLKTSEEAKVSVKYLTAEEFAKKIGATLSSEKEG